MYGQKERRVERMSPKMGRPTDNPKTERLEIRLTKQQAQEIKECADALRTNRTDAIMKGIGLLKESIKK